MNNASRVGEIFTSAGAALNLLGELTMQLESAGPSAPGSGTKWTDQVQALTFQHKSTMTRITYDTDRPVAILARRATTPCANFSRDQIFEHAKVSFQGMAEIDIV